MQCIHIIRVTDPAVRERLYQIAAQQEYVRLAPEFLVFCIDYTKHRRLVPDAQTDYTEALLLGAVDAGITAQNVLLAAESLGLGGVYIGSLRNDIAAAAEALGLPAQCRCSASASVIPRKTRSTARACRLRPS